MHTTTISLPLIGRAATLCPETADPEARTIDLIWTTGAVRAAIMRDPDLGRVEIDEELEVTGQALRLGRINAGAPFLDSHDDRSLASVLGSVVPGSVRIENGRGFATVQLTAAGDAAPLVQRILEGTVRNISVGYVVHRYEITRREGMRDLWRAVDWEPYEISAVPIPADTGAQTRAAGTALFPCALRGEFHEKDTAMSEADTQDPAKTQNDETMPPADPAPAADDPQPQPGPDDSAGIAARAIAAERERVAAIAGLCRRHGLGEAFETDLVRRGVGLPAAREAILDQLASDEPMTGRSFEPARVRDNGAAAATYRAAVENALMHRSGAAPELSADGREFRGMTLMEIARQALERSGTSTRGMSKQDLAGAALGQRAAGYHSSGDFPLVLANIGNNSLRAAYTTTPRTFTAWARRASLSDFRPATRTQISAAPKLELVPESAEFQYGTFGEAKTQYALATYGKIIAFTRQMLINDDLGAFTRVSQSFGARAAQLEGDLVYAILLNNPVLADGLPLFGKEHGNDGTGADINEASLTAAYVAYARQTDIDGTLIDVAPEFILVPPGRRELQARKLLTSVTPATTADVNVYANRLRIITERRLMPKSGPDAWYLAAGNALIDTVEYAYLDGNDGIHTETRNGFEVDGVEIKARLDFAAAAIDHRGLYRNPGKA